MIYRKNLKIEVCAYHHFVSNEDPHLDGMPLYMQALVSFAVFQIYCFSIIKLLEIRIIG